MRRRNESGFTTLQYVVAAGFSLLLLVMMANLLVALYERGAVRDALDEGVRAGVPAGAGAPECRARARAVVDSVAGGSVLRVDDLECVERDGRRVASANVAVRSWFPALFPDWHLRLRAQARVQR